ARLTTPAIRVSASGSPSPRPSSNCTAASSPSTAPRALEPRSRSSSRSPRMRPSTTRRKTMRKLFATLMVLLASSTQANATDLHFDGYVDVRLVVPSNQESWMQGELGKLRYGAGDNTFQFAELVGQAAIQITPALVAIGVGRVEPKQRTFFDVLEAYVRYRPV